jgi:hypothetical protein
MKKLILPVLSLLVFAGISNAQLPQKTPAKNASTVAPKPTVSNKSMTKTAAVSPAKTTQPAHAKKAVAIKRKHHRKAKKSPKK